VSTFRDKPLLKVYLFASYFHSSTRTFSTLFQLILHLSHLLFCDVRTFLTHSNILEGQKYCSNFFSWNTFLSGGKTILQCEKTFSLLFFPTLCMIEDFILHFCFLFSLPYFRPVIYLCVAHSQGFS